MKKNIFTLYTVLFLAPIIISGASSNLCQAEIIEVPFPGFVGNYDGSNLGEFYADIPFIYNPAEIISVSLRLSGSTTAGIAHCTDQPADVSWPIDILASIGNYAQGEFWMASPGVFLEDGSFSFNIPFRTFSSFPETWNLLDDGNGEISFFVGPAMLIGICSGIVEPSAVIDEFVLVFDMVSVVDSEITTWDRLKAQYK